jgi:hypothetical protein
MRLLQALVFVVGIFPSTAFWVSAPKPCSLTKVHNNRGSPKEIGPDTMGGAANPRRTAVTPTDEWWHESNKFHWRGSIQRPQAVSAENGASRSYFPTPSPADTPLPTSETETFGTMEPAAPPIPSSETEKFDTTEPVDTPISSYESQNNMEATQPADTPSIRARTPDYSRRTGPAMIGPESMGGAAFGPRKDIVTPDQEWWHESSKFHWRRQQY